MAIKEKSESEVLNAMAKYCSTCERCVQEVEKKIQAAGLSKEAQERIIGRLTQERFIDERRYCRFFVNDKFKFNKWGRIKIDYELRKKNIPNDIRQEALLGIDETEYENLLTDILKAKLKSVKGKNAYDSLQKTLRFAVGHGFESDLAIKRLKLLTHTDYNENEEMVDTLE